MHRQDKAGKKMEKNRITVEGFTFTDPEMARKAMREAESIQYVKGKLDMDNPRMVHEMYRKLIAEKVFETPVGLAYLKQLRDYLSSVPKIKRNGQDAAPAPGSPGEGRTFGSVQRKTQKVADAKKENPVFRGTVSPAQNSAGQGEAVGEIPLSGAEELAEWYEESLEQEKQKRRTAELKQRRTEEKLKNSRGLLRFSIAGNFFLLLVAIGMIVITLLDDSPNIINYENKILDQYTQWEQELKEREQIIKEKEAELGL